MTIANIVNPMAYESRVNNVLSSEMIINFKMHVISSYPTIFLMWEWERANLIVNYRLQSCPPSMPQPWGLGRALRVEVNSLIISPARFI